MQFYRTDQIVLFEIAADIEAFKLRLLAERETLVENDCDPKLVVNEMMAQSSKTRGFKLDVVLYY